jgi:hypothetical protein
MKKLFFYGLAAVLILATTTALAGAVDYGDVALSGGFQAGHFNDVWDLTAGNITISFTYDGNGLVDDSGAHAWAELGVRSLGSRAVDFNPYWRYTYWTKTVDLVVGRKKIDVGDVVVWGDGQYLFVKYVLSNAGCLLTEIHFAIEDASDKIPQKNGNPIPGHFEYSMEFGTGVPEFTYPPIDATQWSPTAKLYIAAHAVVVCGVKEETAWGAGNDFEGRNWAMYFDYTPTKEAGSGVWLATDYDYTPNTFDPDVTPNLDLDDKLILQRQGGQGEGAYNLPSAPPAPGNNHRVWWDRDGVDPWQNPATANTEGIYQVVITLNATGDTTGTAYINIRGLDQGFEIDGNWNTIELTPAGMTFAGDMKHLQVFYGIFGYGATHSVTFTDITVTQSP